MKKTIYLAGGCFWGVEAYFKRVKGIIDSDTGYANGISEDADYHRLSKTMHAEAVEIDYDDEILSLEELLLHFFRIIDPMSLNRQGNDRGTQYRTGVYYVDEADLGAIESVFAYERSLHGEIVVEKQALKHFVKAENYHQNYLDKNPAGYCHINIAYAEVPLGEEYARYLEFKARN